MKVLKAIHSYQEYYRINSGKKYTENYDFLFIRFPDEFSDRKLGSITTNDILLFLTLLTNETNTPIFDMTAKRRKKHKNKILWLVTSMGYNEWKSKI